MTLRHEQLVFQKAKGRTERSKAKLLMASVKDAESLVFRTSQQATIHSPTPKTSTIGLQSLVWVKNGAGCRLTWFSPKVWADVMLLWLQLSKQSAEQALSGAGFLPSLPLLVLVGLVPLG